MALWWRRSKKKARAEGELVEAAEAGDIERVGKLLEAGLASEAVDEALWAASCSGKHWVVRQVIKAGADINSRHGEEGNTPLHGAARMGHDFVLSILTEQEGADVNARKGLGVTPLHLAAMKGHTDCAKVLLEAGAEVDLKTDWDATALKLSHLEGGGKVAPLLEKWDATDPWHESE